MLGATVVALIAGGITISPPADCPTESAVAAEIAKLGATSSLDQVGDAEVAIDGADLRIVIRDTAGTALGSRTVSAPADCQARAALAAVLIAAWAGEWIRTNLGSLPANGARAPEPPPASSQNHPHLDASVFGFGIHDGDAGTWGGGLQAGVRLETLGMFVVAEASADRQRVLNPAHAQYSFVRIGPGMSARQEWSWAFADIAFVPEVVRYAISGASLARPKDVISWQVWADLRVRFGVTLGAVSPFVYVGGSWSFVKQKLTLDDGKEIGSVSRGNVAAGLGISVTLR